MPEFTDLDGLVERIPDGAILALPREGAGGCAMALVRRAIQRGVRGLHLVGAQGGGLAVELLVGAGCVDTLDGVEIAAASADAKPNFMRPAGDGAVAPAEGSHSTPMADLAIFHAGKVDRHGNIRIGEMRHLMDLAPAAKSIVATYEACVAEDLGVAADTIRAARVAALAEAPLGSSPLGLPGYYEADQDHLALYADAAATADGFQTYLRNHVYQRLAAD